MSEEDIERRLEYAREFANIQREIDSAGREPKTEEQIEHQLELANQALTLFKEHAEYEKAMTPKRSAEEAEAAARRARDEASAERVRRESAERELENLQLKLMSPGDRLLRFVDKHGDPLQIDGALLFADGAAAIPSKGEFTEPPEGFVEKAKARRQYIRACIKRDEKQLKADIEWEAEAARNALKYRNTPSVSREQVDALIARKEALAKMKEHEILLSKVIGDAPPPPYDPSRDSLPYEQLIQTESFRKQQISADLTHLL